MPKNRATKFEKFLLRAEALGHERSAFAESFHDHLQCRAYDHNTLMDICDVRLVRGQPMPWVEKEIERTCWNCTQSRLCFLKQRMDSLLRAGCNILNIDGHDAPGRCYRDLHLALGRSCMLYEENPNAD